MNMSDLDNGNEHTSTGDQPNKNDSSKGGFVGFIMLHNTTIIAIILAVAAMLGNGLERTQQKADKAESEIQQRREYLETETQTLSDEIEELDLQYDSTSPKYQEVAKGLQHRSDSLDKMEAETVKIEHEKETILQHVETQNKTSNMADTIFEVAILLSSISLTSKNKKLTWLATLLTLAGVIAEVLIYFV